MSEKPSNGNQGRIALLLAINTFLTALIIPMVGFFGSRLFNQVDSNAVDLNQLKLQAASDFGKLNIEVGIIKERQQRVLEDLETLHNADQKIQNQLDVHMNRTEGKSNP